MKWIDTLDTITGAGRAFVTTHGVPEDRIQVLRDTLDKVLHNAEFLAQADKINRPISYASGKQIGEKVVKLLSLPDEQVAGIKDVLLDKYVKK